MSSAKMSDWASQLRAYKSGQAVASSSNQHHHANGNGTNANTEHRLDARTKSKITPCKAPSTSHQDHDHKREKVPLLGNKSLERCVQLLNQMMLESDAGEVNKHSKARATLAKAQAKVAKSYKPKMTLKKKNPKAKCKKTKMTHDAPKGSVKPVLKSANIQPAADSTKFDLPERDSNQNIECLPLHRNTSVHFDTCSHPLPAFQMQPVSVPFNKRLSTSTPTQPLDSVSPWKYVPGSSQSICSEEYHLTRAGNNPLNATDQCKEVAPPPIPQPQPKLTEAAFTLTDNPLAPTQVMTANEGLILNEGYSLYSPSTPHTMMSSKNTTQYSDPVPLCSWKENTTVVETSARSQPALVSSSSQTKNTSSSHAPIQPIVLPASITQPLYGHRKIDDSMKDTETQTSVHEDKAGAPMKLRALSDLLKELKAAVSCGNHAAIPGLATDLETTSSSMVWGKKVNQQLELDLAIQPLRTENAQLRRQLRLANLLKKGNKDEVKCEDNAQQDVNAVHFEMMRHQLEATLREERAAMERLRERSCQLQTELQMMSEEKQQLLGVVMKKDEDYVQELDKILSDRKKLCSEVDQLKTQVKESESKMTQQQQLAQVELQGRDEEIHKLQDLVGNLQRSMRRLLTDLQTKPDTSCREIAESTQTTLDSILNGSDAKGMIDDQFNDIQINLHKSSPSSQKSAKKSLFSTEADAVICGSSENLASISDNMGVNMTMSDYDLPPGASPFGSKFRVNEGLTVIELLTPLANRMQHQFNRMHTVKPDDIAGYSSIESDTAESESTLIEEEEAGGKEESVSRYSITDYFTKYSAKQKPASMEKLSERESSSDSSPSPLKGSLRPSVQSSLYKGTDLDTSLSTIPGAEDGRSVVSSEVSTDTISSVDDHAFKRGLAALDANISRMQQQLRVTSQ